MKEERIRLGVVGVDSGQLMICDPGYLNEWKEEEFDLDEISLYRDVETGKEFKHPRDWREEYKDGMSYNEAMEKGLIERIPGKQAGEFSYNGVCQKTLDANYTKHDEGQIPFEKGHAGLAVAFRSGLGDGLYEVWATVKELETWGRRITKVEINLVEEDSEHHKKLTKHLFGELENETD